MTQKEFETLAKCEVSESQFDYINRVYMAATDMSKEDFCKDWMHARVGDSEIVANLTRDVESLIAGRENLMKLADKNMALYVNFKYAMVDFLVIQAEKWSSSDLREKAIELVGIKEYLKRKADMNFAFWKADFEELQVILSKRD